MNGKLSTAAIVIILIFAAVLELIIFNGKHFTILISVMAIIACIPYYVSKGNKRTASKELWTNVFMVVLSTVFLLVSYQLGFFKPCTTITIAAGMFFGVSTGFTCGFFSVILTSVLTGLGGWTIYQSIMLGLVGFLAGIFSRQLNTSTIPVIIITLISSFLFSCTSVLNQMWNAEKGFDFSSYSSILSHSTKWFIFYAVIDTLVMLLVKKHFIKKSQRLKKRFRIFEYGRKF